MTNLASVAIRDFNAQFPTERDCVEELKKRAASADLLRCRYCGNKDVEKKYGDRIVKCTDCKRKTWFTAGTLFERAKNTRPWLAYIWLLEHGVVVSSSWLHKHLNIAQSSALVMIKKITTAVTSRMGEDASTVHSSLFLHLICKRSRETPARAHPRAEQAEIDRTCTGEVPPDGTYADSDPCSAESEGAGHAGPGQQDPCEAAGLASPEKEIYELLAEEPVHTDTLCQLSALPAGAVFAALTMLELAELAVRLPGDKYARSVPKQSTVAPDYSFCEAELTPEITNMVNGFSEFLRCIFHGVSRKYLQNYLAVYWCYADRARWCHGSLLKACLGCSPVSYSQILAYVTPAMVEILAS